ncbi:MAG: hypothetical protein HY393_01320 [Candidatus Diapherotrites archaeon]|nr:hypothetical protein [Candidatus Diapherotrites archaeon]
MEKISLKEIPQEVKVALLKELGFGVDSRKYVIDASGRRVLDKYIKKEVTLDNLLILPGSTLILDDNELSLTLYLEEYGDVL